MEEEWLPLPHWKVMLFLLPASFLKKTCLPFDNSLTFDSLFRPISQRWLFFFLMLPVSRSSTWGKTSCHSPQAYQRQLFTTPINIRYCAAIPVLFTSFIFIYFIFFLLNQSSETSSLTSELNPDGMKWPTFQCQRVAGDSLRPNLLPVLPERCSDVVFTRGLTIQLNYSVLELNAFILRGSFSHILSI